jgi:hypothetical protein
MTTVEGEKLLRETYNEIMKDDTGFYNTFEKLIDTVEIFSKSRPAQMLLKTGFIKHNYPNSFVDVLSKAFNALEEAEIPFQYISIGEDNALEEREFDSDDLTPNMFTKIDVEIDYTSY